MNKHTFSPDPIMPHQHPPATQAKRLGTLALVTILLLLSLFLGLERLAAWAAPSRQAGPRFSIVKTASHASAARGVTLTFSIDVRNVGDGPGSVNVADLFAPEMKEPLGVTADANVSFEILPHGLAFSIRDLLPGHGARLVYQTAIRPDAGCGEELVNRAQLMVNDEPIGQTAETRLFVICSDLGDAPASDNRFLSPMHTLGGVEARYPTVYDPPFGAPSGPLHRRADLMHLGKGVSFERQADGGPDSDLTNNVLPSVNAPNLDTSDDGLLNRANLAFSHCEPATLQFQVYADAAVVQDAGRAFINVWFDGNRDGDWADVNVCESLEGLQVPEHILIDHPVSVITGLQTVLVSATLPVFNPRQDEPTWLRVTLGEQRSVKTGQVGAWHYGDGRGVFSTLVDADSGKEIAGFEMGETEDYLLPSSTPQAGLVITKTVDRQEASFGHGLAFRVQVTNTHPFAQAVTLFDPIPPGTTHVSNTFTTTLIIPTSGYDAASNAIFWRGEVPAHQSLTVEFGVRVVRCAPFGFEIVNRAWAFEPGFSPVEGKTMTHVSGCSTPPRRIQVDKLASPHAVPGGEVEFSLVAQSLISDVVAPLVVMDPLPFGLALEPASLPPGVAFIPPNFILWETQLAPHQPMTITYSARVHEWACRERRLTNQAHWWSEIGLDGYSNPTWTEVVCSDLGDAPDSVFNRHGIANTAYNLSSTVMITVDGRYPSVWQTPNGEPGGPRHLDAARVWLGGAVSLELEADAGPDTDGLNNILAFGQDNADDDRFDDGWLNPHTPLPDCQQATLRVRVFKEHYAVKEMWLNVWFDGNRDGDWEDLKPCDNRRVASEWIVRNFMLDTSAWPAGAYRDVLVRTFLVMNDHEEWPAWMRFTLSERQPPRNPNTGLADGRGPDFYRRGETEDYLAAGALAGAPGKVSVHKTASAVSVTVGQAYTYSVYITHTGGSGPARVVMTDVLPAELRLAGGPTVVESSPNAGPLVTAFDSHVGPSGAVGWRGVLSPDAAIRVGIPVRVRHCPIADARVIRNAAVVDQLGASPIPPAIVETGVDCQPPPAPDVRLQKHILTDLGERLPAWTTVPGRHVNYLLVLSGTNQFTYTLHVSDPLPGGVTAIAADASSGVAHVIQGGRGVVWDGRLGPANAPVTIRIRAKLWRVRCGDVVENVAHWTTPWFTGGESNVTRLKLACHDLGDAPDSSNHSGVDMTAYPGVTAAFPTVFSGTTPLTPSGPLHLRPGALHLGPRVSFEIEADLGIDLDGVNNIEPRVNEPDLDQADDGLELNELRFAHCETKRIPVWVSIAPSVLPATREERLAYINMWVDGFRDGDWDDAAECPAGENAWIAAPEHIVIDHAINLTALGPGLHRVYVTTTGPVPWPADLSGPAWLRVTLSEKQSNKTLFAGCGSTTACAYGDGRGYDAPFELGETEDHLLRPPDQPLLADLAIEKRGIVRPFFEFDSETGEGTRVWGVAWTVHYENVGGAAVTGIQVTDTLGGDQESVRVYAHPTISPTVNGATLTFSVDALEPGESGRVFIRASVPFSTAPGTALTNSVTITGRDDSDPTNNSQVMTVTIPLLPPWIAFPTPGTTCTGLFTITGRAQLPGATVEIFMDHVSMATVTDDAQGRWSHPVNLPDGAYQFQARASFGSHTSSLSPPVKVIVDSSLVWNPLSLRFVSAHGRVVIPKDADGRTDENGWFVFLRPGETYTVTVLSCCGDPNTSITLMLPDGQVIELQDPDGDGRHEGTFDMPEGTLLLPGSPMRLCVVCYNAQYCSDGAALIDPEGVVYDVTLGPTSLLPDAVVACYEGQTDLDSGETTYGPWDAESYGGQVNPQTTAADGYFSFFTPAGVFQLNVLKGDYQPYQSWDLVVVDEPVEFDVPLTPRITQEADVTVTVNESGFDPPVLAVEPGTVVAWVNVGDELHTSTSTTPTARVADLALLDLGNTDGWDSGLLASGETYKRQLDTPGHYTYYDHENTVYTGLVVVEQSYPLYLPLVLKVE